VAATVALPTVLAGRHDPPSEPARPVPAATASCPDSFPDPVRNTGPGLADRLVPFRVEAATICRYERGARTKRPAGYTSLAASWPLSADRAVALTDLLGRGPVDSHPTNCQVMNPGTADPVIVQLSGSGRTLSVRVDLVGCPGASNGVRRQYLVSAAVTWLLTEISELQGSAHCPATLPAEPSPTGPADRLVPFQPARLLLCRYVQPAPEKGWPQERALDGPAAADYLRWLEALPTRSTNCAGLHPGIHYDWAIVVAGAAGRVTLVGHDYNCSAASNGRRTVYGDPFAR
jgi:hypothetical protein